MGHVGPAIVKNDVFQTSEELDLGPWYPNYMRLHNWREILDLDHGNHTSEHGEVPLHLSQHSLSLSGWRSPTVAVGTASGRGRRLVLEKSVERTGPTSVHNRYIVVRYFDTHKNDIYKKKLKIEITLKKHVPISPRSSPRGMGMSGSLEKLISS
jgi:hypothetical protein